MQKLVEYEVDERKQVLIDELDDKALFDERLEDFSPQELVELQVIFWNYVIDFSLLSGEKFDRHNLTGRMESTSNYQYRVGCNERIDYCRGNICFNTHPVCAGNKLKAQIGVLREILIELKRCQ
jgi:hypothetical protein